MKQFGKEFTEEVGEESVENILQKLDTRLAFIAQVYLCLSPGKMNLTLGTQAGVELGIRRRFF